MLRCEGQRAGPSSSWSCVTSLSRSLHRTPAVNVSRKTFSAERRFGSGSVEHWARLENSPQYDRQSLPVKHSAEKPDLAVLPASSPARGGTRASARLQRLLKGRWDADPPLIVVHPVMAQPPVRLTEPCTPRRTIVATRFSPGGETPALGDDRRQYNPVELCAQAPRQPRQFRYLIRRRC